MRRKPGQLPFRLGVGCATAVGEQLSREVAGRNADVVAACAPALEFAPRSVLCMRNISFAYLLDGKRDAARPLFDRWAQQWGGGGDRQVAELFEALDGRTDRNAFAQKLAATPDRAWNDPESGYLMGQFEIPLLLVLLDEKELALRYAERQVERSGTDNLAWALLMPAMDPVRCDPRFTAVVGRLKVKDPRAATLCAAKRGGP